MTTLVIYHAECMDGSSAAWVAKKALRFCDLHAAKHGSEPPDCTGVSVLMVDFTYPKPQMEKILDECQSLTVLDHHATAVKNLAGLEYQGVIDQTKSGAMLSWIHFHHDIPAPEVLLRVQDRDLWKFEYPDTKDVMSAFMAYDFEDLDVVDILMRKSVDELETIGVGINLFRDKLIKQAVTAATPVMIAGHEVLAANCPYTIGSDVAGELAKGKSFGAYWYVENGLERWGLRSTQTGSNVADIAESFGGGGHVHASGFRGAIIEYDF